MSDKDQHKGWELRSFSSGNLKRSSSVEILLAPHPTRGRLLATSPNASNRLVTSHNMEGRGRPKSTEMYGTLPPSVAPPSDPSTSSASKVQNGGVAKTGARDTEAVQPQEIQPQRVLPQGAQSQILQPQKVHPQIGQTQMMQPQAVQPQAVQGKEKPLPMNPELKGFSSLRRKSKTPFPPIPMSPITSTPASPASPASSTPAPQTPPPPSSTSLPFNQVLREAAKTLATLNSNPLTPPMARLKNVKEKGRHLPPLVTTHKLESQSPIGTPRSTPRGTPKSTPLGTPVIGKRGHVFSVSTPEVEPETGQPFQPFPPEGKKRTVAECVGDPFEQRRRIKPEPEEKDKESGTAEGEDEPVWQRRLSLLFVPPTEDELEDPEKEPEETTRLLPLSTTHAQIIRRQSVESVPTPPRSRRRDREDKPRSKKERASKKDSDAKLRKGSDDEDQGSPARIIYEEERSRKKEERSGKEEEKNIFSKFSRLRRSSLGKEEEIKRRASSDETPPSASDSSLGSSEEEEEDKVLDSKDPGDDYNWDDTICSNRSAYFKKYYSQRGVIGRASEDKESAFKSPFGDSHNSLSSLIREKMGKTTPQGKPGIEIGLVVMVVVLLVVIVVGISLTSYFYHLHLLELFIFKCIKFYEETRILEMYDESWKPIITLHLGTNLPQHSIPNECTAYLNYLQERNTSLPHHGLDDDDYDDMICLDWSALAQVHLRKIHSAGSVQCYSVWWLALKDNFTLRDCIMPDPWEDKERNITWWGGGEMTTGGYPVTRGDVPPTRMVTGRLDRDPWGQLLRRVWISDRATLLMLPARFPGKVSVNHQQDRQVCLEVPVTPCSAYDPNLSYTLCKAPNLTALAGYLHQRAVHERHEVSLAAPSLVTASEEESRRNTSEGDTEMTVLRETFAQAVVARVEERLETPVWIPWMTPYSPHLTQEAVLSYVDRVLRNATTAVKDEGPTTNTTEVLGHVLLPASWQRLPGEMEFDPERFPDPVGLSQALRVKGFHLALTLHPFVSVDATGFKPGLREGLWVKQKNSSLPALARYDDRYASVVTDFSNLRARQWYAEQLQKLNDKYEIDRFHLQPADGYVLPTFHQHHRPVHGSDDTLVHFMAAVTSVSPPVSTEGAVMPPLPPTFVTMGTGDGSWDALETLVPRLLTLTMLGYPFIDVGPIGGLARAGHVPERELYIRWIEAAAFLPAMQISVLPTTYDEEVQVIARQYQHIRKELVLPRLKDKVQDALDNGTPLITPLNLFVPDDMEAAKVDDQWMLGDDLLVAPVTRRGERRRTFYLPEGIWKDGINGHLANGGRWVRNYPVALNKIPHFFLKPVHDFQN